MTRSPAQDRQPQEAPPAISLEALAAALELEDRLLHELIGAIRDQRDGVAAEDIDRVNDGVFAAHRVLRTMGEARRRRRTLLSALTGTEDVSLHDLDAALGAAITDAVRSARDRVSSTARTLSREIALNRRILQDAQRVGDARVNALFDATLAAVCDDESASAGALDESLDTTTDAGSATD